MRTALLFVAAALAVGGCHNTDYDKSPADDLSGKDAKAVAAIDDAVDANSTAATKAGLPVPAPSPILGNHDLPVAFTGRWGITKADCDPDRMDTKGLLVVEPDKLKFYESRAAVTAIDQHSGGDVTVKLNVEGEGQQWQTVTELQLDAGDTQLLRIEQSPPQTYRYKRC